MFICIPLPPEAPFLLFLLLSGSHVIFSWQPIKETVVFSCNFGARSTKYSVSGQSAMAAYTVVLLLVYLRYEEKPTNKKVYFKSLASNPFVAV